MTAPITRPSRAALPECKARTRIGLVPADREQVAAVADDIAVTYLPAHLNYRERSSAS